MAKKQPKASDLPETLFVRYVPMTERDPAYFQAHREADDHAELNEPVEIGEYKLVRVVRAVNETRIEE